MKQATLIGAGFLAFVALILGFSSIYQVHVTETAIITQFGKVIGEPVTEPGIHFKIPFAQDVNRVEKRILEWDGPPLRMTTRDKVFLQVDSFARWRVKDPLKYFLSLREERRAQSRLDDIIAGATLNVVARYELIELIRSEKNRTISPDLPKVGSSDAPVSTIFPISNGRAKLELDILAEALPSLTPLGIELMDFRFKRLNYSDETQRKIYDRMISERAQIAEQFRSEGAGSAARISGDRERELKKIQSEAYAKVQTLRGNADAEAAQIYAKAFNSSPEAAEFYSFQKTLDAYEEIISNDTTLVLTTDSDIYSLLKQLPPLPTPSGAKKPTPTPTPTVAPAVPAPPAPTPAPAAPTTPAVEPALPAQ